MNINLSNKTWIKHWAGHWKLLSNSLLGYQYGKLLEDAFGKGLTTSLFISRKGYSVCYIESECYKEFSQYLAEKHMTNKEDVARWSDELEKTTDKILELINELEDQEIDGDKYKNFIKVFYEFGVPTRMVKASVDALAPEKLELFLPILSKARVYAEPVYAETEKFLEKIANQIARKEGYNKEHLLYITKDEMIEYWESGVLPEKSILADRYESCALISYKGEEELLIGEEAKNMEKMAEPQDDSQIIKGSSAYQGIARGTARVILDARVENNFAEGDILVTGMTRPEYIPLIKKSIAFVTDAGGMLSHAAISAREFQIPCVVGTLVATKRIKDGDEIEVDANNGVVKIIK